VDVLARHADLLDEAVEEISALTDGGRAHAVAGDSTAPADLTRTSEETMPCVRLLPVGRSISPVRRDRTG
jgi:hypothetical protein